MYLNVNDRVPLSRQTELDFVVPILVDIYAPGHFFESEALECEHNSECEHDDGHETPEYLIGRVWAERLDWSYAEECDVAVHSVCDAASAVWMQALDTLTVDGFQLRKDLNLDDFVQNVIYLHEILIHPDTPDRISVVDAVLRAVSCGDSLILMQHEQGLTHHLDDWEYRDLGFKKIARSNLLLKDCHYRYAFHEANPRGRPITFAANVEHEQWIEEQWKCLIADHPAL